MRFGGMTRIQEIFEKRAFEYEDKTALISGDDSVTYGELNSFANAIAEEIEKFGLDEGEMIGILMDKGIDAVASMLGILKTGRGYIPVEPDYPEERIGYIVGDSGMKLILTDISHSGHPAVKNLKTCIPERRIMKKSNPPLRIGANDPAYIIYTSGTTGKPKGVVITQDNVVGLFKNTEKLFSFSENDVWTIFHSFGFDFSVWEIYGSLLYGGTGIISDKDTCKDSVKFVSLLSENKVTVLNQVPSSFYNTAEADAGEGSVLGDLRYVIFGGENLKPGKLSDFRNTYPETKLINMYGITEITVHGTFKEITETEISSNHSNIGLPIPGFEFTILDVNTQEPADKGVTGEIAVSGYGLAVGYRNLPELTEARFISKNGKRFYLSGDLGTENKNGEITYRGRKDNQVQLKGFRVELSEAEKAMMKNSRVKDCVVLAHEDIDGNDELSAFYTSETELTVKELRKHLTGLIPSYMIPSYFIKIDSVPLTSNGKYDRRALLKIKEEIKVNTGTEIFTPATTDLQRKILNCVSSVLHSKTENLSENFTVLGGDSLKAAKLITLLKKDNITTDFRDILDSYTLLELTERILHKNESLQKYSAMDKAYETQNYKGVTFQEGRIFAASSVTAPGDYNITKSFEITGKAETETIKNALLETVLKNDVFSWSYYSDGGPVKKKPREIKDIELTIYEMSREDLKLQAKNIIRKMKPLEFPLFQFILVRHSDEDSTLIMNFHHIIMDGISMEYFAEEFLGNIKGETSEKENDNKSYLQYAAYQEKYTESSEYKEDSEFWSDFLSDGIKEDLTSDFSSAKKGNSEGEVIKRDVNKETASLISSLAKKYRISRSMLTQGIFHILMGRLTDTERLITGTVSSGRPEEFMNTKGMFVNTLPFVSVTEHGMSTSEFFESEKERTFSMADHSHFPLEEMELPYEMGGVPFSALFIYQGFRGEDEIKASGMTFKNPYEQYETGGARFPLTFEYFSEGEKEYIKLSFDSTKYRREKMERFLNMYFTLLASVGRNPQSNLFELTIIPDGEQIILDEFMKSDRWNIKRDERDLTTYVSEKISENPSKNAVVSCGESLTFRDVDEISDAVSELIVNCGIKSNDIVALLIPRSCSLYASMVSAVKSGAGLLVIDTELPEERISFILEDADPKVILSTPGMINTARKYSTGRMVLEISDRVSELPRSSKPCRVIRQDDDLAYVIYTSGTTGRPKGVKLRSRSAVNMADFLASLFRSGPSQYLSVAAVTFDMFIIDFFLSIGMNSTFILPGENERTDNERVAELMRKHDARAGIMTPSRLDLFLETHPEEMKNFKYILCGGEVLKESTVKKAEAVTDARFFDFYGPSETTVYCCGKEVISGEEKTVGYPAAFSEVYITGKNMELMPYGYEGEICVGGESVGLGYINRDELTKEKFTDNPFGAGKIYRTGDRGMYTDKGEIIFLGRKDGQVKYHGFRIETGEIEKVMTSCTGVISAEVRLLNPEGKGDRLAGFYTGGKDEKELYVEISSLLPYYMMPELMNLELLPFTRNGKVDDRKLAEIFAERKQSAATNGASYEDLSPSEKKILGCYREILGSNTFRSEDSFFFAGGDSIKAIRLSSLLRKKGFDISVSEIMDASGPAEIFPKAFHITSRTAETEEISGKNEEKQVLNPIMKYFFEKNSLEKIWEENFHMSGMLMTDGITDRHKAEDTFREILLTHREFTARFTEGEDGPEISYGGEIPEFFMEEYSVREKDLEKTILEAEKNTHRKIDLKNGNYLAACLIRTESREYIIYAVHHLLCDGITQRIITEEFTEGYTARRMRKQYIPIIKSGYQKYSKNQNSLETFSKYEKDLSYWTEMEISADGFVPVNARTLRPSDHTLSAFTAKTGKETAALVTDSENLKKFSTELKDVLLSSVTSVLRDTGEENMVITMEGHGREEDAEDILETPGWFTTVFPVVIKHGRKDTLEECLADVRSTMSKVPSKGYSYGILKYSPHLPEDKKDKFRRNEVPGYSFNFLGDFTSSGNTGLFRTVLKNETQDISSGIDLGIGMNFNIHLQDGDIVVGCVYNKEMFSAEYSEKITHMVIKRIEEFGRILSGNEMGQTALLNTAQYSDSGLSASELNELMDYMGIIA